MLKAYKAFEKLPTTEIERVHLAYMFFSDATHLASFSDTSIWPLYTDGAEGTDSDWDADHDDIGGLLPEDNDEEMQLPLQDNDEDLEKEQLLGDKEPSSMIWIWQHCNLSS